MVAYLHSYSCDSWLFSLFLLYRLRFSAVPSTSFPNFSLGPLLYFCGWILSLLYIPTSSFQSVVSIFPAMEVVAAFFAFCSTSQPFLHLNFGFASEWGAALKLSFQLNKPFCCKLLGQNVISEWCEKCLRVGPTTGQWKNIVINNMPDGHSRQVRTPDIIRR